MSEDKQENESNAKAGIGPFVTIVSLEPIKVKPNSDFLPVTSSESALKKVLEQIPYSLALTIIGNKETNALAVTFSWGPASKDNPKLPYNVRSIVQNKKNTIRNLVKYYLSQFEFFKKSILVYEGEGLTRKEAVDYVNKWMSENQLIADSGKG